MLGHSRPAQGLSAQQNGKHDMACLGPKRGRKGWDMVAASRFNADYLILSKGGAGLEELC